ncbi:hypothetical protein SAMN05444396_10742 [Flavobacterium segetis]|uniref:Uncharacterized protein n=1 Tax=Flavobacterium segetis TaxID=271157 RepID=A0A1M5IHZ4_9FLAO|nr:hypothetical protein SAMN05444396_10742 [Flavobacterium segetis]
MDFLKNREWLSVMSYQLSVNSINRVNVLSQQQSKNGIRQPTTENGYELSVIRK